MHTPDVYDITSASWGRGESIKGRKRRYLIAMSIRVACFIGMVALPISLEWRGALALGAIFLPYIAVVLANAYDGRRVSDTRAAQWNTLSPHAPAIDRT